MAIDGRDLVTKREAPVADAYNSSGARVAGQLLFWIPLAFLVWVTYVGGAAMGGPLAGGVGSVAMTAAGVVVMYLNAQRKKGR